MSGLTLYEFRDLDLMFKLRDENGGITSQQFAESLGFDKDGAAKVASRLTWMRRYGMLDFDPKARLWSVAASGERVTEAHLRSRDIQALDQLPDEAMVEVMAHVTSRYRHDQGTLAHLLRREFLYGTARR